MNHKNNFDPLDNEEKELMDSLEKDEWISVDNLPKEMEHYQKIFSDAEKPNQKVEILLSPKDLFFLQKIAHQDGIPTPLLISSVLHKYVTGKLVENDHEQVKL